MAALKDSCVLVCFVLIYLCLIMVKCDSDNTESTSNYLIGVGISDITGPAAEVNMMGYANPEQTTAGIHFRQFSRAFIIADSENKTRSVFVSIDTATASQIVKLEVVKKLAAAYGPDVYTERNLVISSIHTHSGAGGYYQYLLFEITSLGFVKESYDALVNGIVQSIDNAHRSIRSGNIYISEGELLDTNINRSPAAYVNNPENEKQKYEYNVDKMMTVLKMVDSEGHGIGMISWFAVHCTSMNNTNRLISGDNKGYASQLFEKQMNPNHLPGQGSFVAAFAQSNEGDVSPNTKGPHCTDSGRSCDILTSTCHGKNELCVASGPGRDMTESTKIIGEKQFKKAKDLYDAATKRISGPIDFRHSYVDMPNVKVPSQNSTRNISLCKPAMGYSFAAGTTDGPGMFDFEQGDTSTNIFWNTIRNLLKKPTPAQVACHHPKPILLDTGEIRVPYLWQPQIVEVQILRLGQLAIIAVPAEFTTMSGRRTRDAVTTTLKAGGFPSDTVSVIAGLSNVYSDYVATYEEYQVQRYEGASTIYGPHTLDGYIQTFKLLADNMAKGVPSAPGPNPPNLLSKQLSFLPPVIFDHSPMGKKFGDVLVDCQKKYFRNTSVNVTFVSANPRNSIGQTGSTFLTVEMLKTEGRWEVIATDANWETKYEWRRTSTLFGESVAIITWNIPSYMSPGTYVIKHFAYSKTLFGTITPFSGMSSIFHVLAGEKL